MGSLMAMANMSFQTETFTRDNSYKALDKVKER